MIMNFCKAQFASNCTALTWKWLSRCSKGFLAYACTTQASRGRVQNNRLLKSAFSVPLSPALSDEQWLQYTVKNEQRNKSAYARATLLRTHPPTHIWELFFNFASHPPMGPNLTGVRGPKKGSASPRLTLVKKGRHRRRIYPRIGTGLHPTGVLSHNKAY